MSKINSENYLQDMIDNNEVSIVFPKEKSEKAAETMFELIDSAIGLAQFKTDDGDVLYGVLINNPDFIKDHIKLY